MANDVQDIRDDLQSHLVECAKNYSDLHAETMAQNAKIDALTSTVETLVKVIIRGVGWIVVSSTSIAAFVITHVKLDSFQ